MKEFALNKSELEKALRLYLVTDHRLTKGRSTESIVEQAIESGVTIVQLRDKGKNTVDLLETGFHLRKITKDRGIPLLVNDRCDLCLALGADGVHLGQSDMPLQYARRILGQNAIIGISVTNLNEALDAEVNGASYVAVNGVFATDTKTDLPVAPLGSNFITKLRRQVTIPIIAIGGVKPENTRQIILAGCDGVAVVTGITLANDIRAACQNFLKEISFGLSQD